MDDLSPETIRAARDQVGLSEQTMPRSVAIIMDGNGRWARKRGLPRTAGHAQGAETVSKIIREAARLGLSALALYSFSMENWSRPPEEVDALMHIYAKYLVRERPLVISHNLRVRHLGRRDGLPESVLRELDESCRVSQENSGMFLALALNYGSRIEMTDAVARIARRVADGEVDPAQIDQQMISDALDTKGVPDPDLLIRTSGEMRLSNFLLWQLSYAEFYITDVYWPDFSVSEFHKALLSYGDRHRRFGGVDESNT
jgi:undecaprenyl diphosphate synthase